MSICKLKKPKCVRPVGRGSGLSLPPAVVPKPEPTSPSLRPLICVSCGARDKCTEHRQIEAATARPHFTPLPAEFPSAFGMRKLRHQSELSKKFRFHVFSPKGGTLTDSAHVMMFRDQASVSAWHPAWRVQLGHWRWAGCCFTFPRNLSSFKQDPLNKAWPLGHYKAALGKKLYLKQ